MQALPDGKRKVYLACTGIQISLWKSAALQSVLRLRRISGPPVRLKPHYASHFP